MKEYISKELNLCNNERKKKYFQHVLQDKLNQIYPDTLLYCIPCLNILLRVLEGGGVEVEYLGVIQCNSKDQNEVVSLTWESWHLQALVT